MTKEEFLKKMEEYGIKLGKYQIIVDEYMPISYFLGVYKRNEKWLIYEIGERNQVSFLYEENTEDKIFDDFYQAIFGRLGMMGFLNKSITSKVIETSKGYVCNFLQKKYNISQSDAEDTWNYLLYNFRVLNEVKYFALNNDFVPAKNCCKIRGYSAQDVYNIVHKQNSNFTEIDAFKYLINLEKDPDRYLSKK